MVQSKEPPEYKNDLNIHRIHPALGIFWALIKSDIWTFIIPDTLFGVLSALTGPLLTTSTETSFWRILQRTPLAMLVVSLNLIIFTLANQRLASDEDALNKPYRPIPSGRITPLQMRRILLCTIPITLGVSFYLDVLEETLIIIGLTWMYNDLGGGDENFVIRDLIIATAFAVYNLSALLVICHGNGVLNTTGYQWTFLISMVIFCTMSIQDLKDQKGDKARGRSTLPLALGDALSRWVLVVQIITWSLICPFYIGVHWLGFIVPLVLGLSVVSHLLLYKTPRDDKRSWDMWAGWLICLYCLPLIKSHEFSFF